MAVLFNALQVRDGALRDKQLPFGAGFTSISQPSQFVSAKTKRSPEWQNAMMDWLEWQGYKQLETTVPAMLKDYRMAAGVIDRSDYIIDEENDVSELINELSKENAGALELKFYPIVPPILNTLCGEFAKRTEKIAYRGVDDRSYNELINQKQEQVEQALVSKKQSALVQALIAAGHDPEDEEFLQQTSPEAIKELPEIQQYFSKTYQSQAEQWATHQHRADSERFHMRELEQTAIRDSLTVRREFWHFDMFEDDYNIEVWNPVMSFYHKSPSIKYISQGNYAGHFKVMTISDVVDTLGWKMTGEQIRSLEQILPASGNQLVMGHRQKNDGAFYDATQSHEDNTNMPSLGMRQYLATREFLGVNNTNGGNQDWFEEAINSESPPENILLGNQSGMLRVMRAYWKSQRELYFLTYFDDMDIKQTIIVDETYKSVLKPTYDTSMGQPKSEQTLLGGEHLECLYINEVWGGTKICRNAAMTGSTPGLSRGTELGFTPIYLDVAPLKFQFRGESSLYGARLPVEGYHVGERNAGEVSLVRRLRAPQIGFNLVNNQISDILIDELGTIIAFDQNAIPQNSMGEDWGKGNYQRAYVAMKDFSMLPLDTTLANTENATNFQHYQVLNMEQTNRLLGRIQYAGYFEQLAYKTVGISPQRLGEIAAQETAEGIQQAVANSYAQTEMEFVIHSEHLMPRVHAMRTNLAQYYHCTNPSVRLQYITSEDEKVNFEINGIDELTDVHLNVYPTVRIDTNTIKEKLRQLILTNNTSNASIYDLGSVIKAESLAEISNVMKEIEQKAERHRQEDRQQQQDLQQQENEAIKQQQEAMLENENYERQLDRESDERIAEIRASAMTGGQDLNANGENDFIDTAKFLDAKQAREEEHNFRREDRVIAARDKEEDRRLKRAEIQAKLEQSRAAVTVARTNKNKYDKPKPSAGKK